MRILFFLLLAFFFQLSVPLTQTRPSTRRLESLTVQLNSQSRPTTAIASAQDYLNRLAAKNYADRTQQILNREKEEASKTERKKRMNDLASESVARSDKYLKKTDSPQSLVSLQKNLNLFPAVKNNNSVQNQQKNFSSLNLQEKLALPSQAENLISVIEKKIRELRDAPENAKIQAVLSDESMQVEDKLKLLEELQPKVEALSKQKEILENSKNNLYNLKNNIQRVEALRQIRTPGINVKDLDNEREQLYNALKDFDIKSILAETQGSRVDRSFDNLDNQIQQPISLPDNKPVNLSLPPITIDRRGSSVFEGEDSIYEEITTPKNSLTSTDTPQPDQDEFDR